MSTNINGDTGVSKIQDDKVTEDKLNLISTGSVPSLEAKGTSGVTDGYIQLNCAENSHGIKLKSPPHSAGASYTLTFPNNDGDADQFLQTNGSGVMSWAAPSGGGLTLLATANTTSGTSVSSGTLDLSGYKQVWTDMYSVGPAVNGGFLQFQPNGGTATYYIDGTVSTTQAFYGTIIHDLTSGNWFANPTTTQGGRNDTARVGNGAASNQGVNTGLTTSTTSITWSWTNGVAFNAGIIRIYGFK